MSIDTTPALPVLDYSARLVSHKGRQRQDHVSPIAAEERLGSHGA